VSHRTTKARNRKQKLKATYGRVREEAQLQGIIPTTPEGAAKPERVNPAVQSEQQFPRLVAEAVRNGWATPDEHKPKIVDALIEPFTKRDVVTAPDGSTYELPPDRHLLKENAKVLATLDKLQYERDHPKDDAQAQAGDVNINNQVNVVQVNWSAMTVDPVHDDPLVKALEKLDGADAELAADGAKQGVLAERRVHGEAGGDNQQR